MALLVFVGRRDYSCLRRRMGLVRLRRYHCRCRSSGDVVGVEVGGRSMLVVVVLVGAEVVVFAVSDASSLADHS